MSSAQVPQPTEISGPKKVQAQFSRFLFWLEEYQNHLWTLSLFPSWNKEDITNDFLDILLQTRKRFLQNPQFDEVSALNLFWTEWNKRGHQQAKNKGKIQLWVPLMLFGFKWPLARVSQLTGWTLSHIRFVTLETLRNLNKASLAPLSLSRDCLRSDLFVIEYLLGENWHDAFQVFGPKQLGLHLKNCPRCSKQLEHLNEAISVFKNVNIEELPRYLEHHLTQLKLPKTRTQAWTFEYKILGLFPKMLVQFSIVAFALFTLLNIPFVGEFKNLSATPSFTKAGSTLGQWWDSGKTWIADQKEKLTQMTASETPTPAVENDVLVAKNEDHPAPTPELETAPILNPLPTPPVAPPVTEEPKKDAEAPVQTKVLPAAPPKNQVAAEKIFLRWGAFSNELDVYTPKILEILSRYSAEMAGDLSLGAEYRGGRYFHFRIPVEHRELLKKEIAALKMKNFYVDTAKSNRDEIPGKIRIVFLLRPHKN